MLILYAIFWFTVASSHPFSSSILWYDAEIDMSNIDVVITLTNGSTPYYGIVVNTDADGHISNMAITLPNSTVFNTAPMIMRAIRKGILQATWMRSLRAICIRRPFQFTTTPVISLDNHTSVSFDGQI